MTINELSSSKTLPNLRKVLVLSFLIPLFFVWRFFAGERFYPHTPIHPLLGMLPDWLDYCCFGLLILLQLAIFFRKNPQREIAAFLVFSLAFSLWDQSRWMPYFYQFYFMFLAMLSYRWDAPNEKDAERVFNTLRIVVLPIWLWSGLHKVSAAYVAIGFPWMMRAFLPYIPAEYHRTFLSMAFISPFVEAGGALMLLFPKTRILGLLSITSMHCVILLIFGPLGLNWNPSVWSWNVAMIYFAWVLFYRSNVRPKQIIFGTAVLRSQKLVHRITMLMFLVLPSLNFFGYWDDFLSHCLYSWTTREAEIVVSPESEKRLPPEMLKTIHHEVSPAIVSVLDWSFDVFNSPPYHSYRVFHSVFGKVCEYTHGDQGLTFRIFDKPKILTAHTERISYKCAPDLGPREIREVERRP